MKICKIELENVKCFSKQIISLEKEDAKEPLSVCALVGANGSGKSSVLKALVATFSELNYDYGGELLEDDAVYWGQDEARVRVDILFNEQEKKAMNAQVGGIRLDYGHFLEPDDFGLQDTLYIPQEMFPQGVVLSDDEYIGLHSDFLWCEQTGLIMYYDPFRFVSKKNPAGPNIQVEEDAKKHALTSNIGPDGSNLYRDLELKQWVVNMDYMRLKEPTERNLSIYNHIIKAFDLLLHPLKFETINQNGSLVFVNEKDNQRTTIDMLSDGFKSIFSIALDIIKRLALAPDFEDEEFYMKEAVVLIDEIDCHIHPKWQRKLMPAFRELFPNCQFIITTHSPYILDTLQEYEIRKVGEKQII